LRGRRLDYDSMGIELRCEPLQTRLGEAFFSA
jgi:hypothetical protein